MSRLVGANWSLAATAPARLTYELDQSGNRVTDTSNLGGLRRFNSPSGTYQRDPMDRYLRIDGPSGSVERRYDNKGNLIDDGVFEYVFDFDDRLLEIRRKADGQQVVRYTYDACARRMWQSRSGGNSGEVTAIWDGWRRVEERDEDDTVLANYFFGNHLDE